MAWLTITTLLGALALLFGFAGFMRGCAVGRPVLGAVLGLSLGPIGLYALSRFAAPEGDAT